MNSSNSNRNNLHSESLQAAAQAAAQINAQLAAEGKIQPQQQPTYQASNNVQKKDKKVKTGRKDLFNAEVEINGLPPRVRNLLTKGYIQEQIQWKSSKLLENRLLNPILRLKTISSMKKLHCVPKGAMCPHGKKVQVKRDHCIFASRQLINMLWMKLFITFMISLLNILDPALLHQ